MANVVIRPPILSTVFMRTSLNLIWSLEICFTRSLCLPMPNTQLQMRYPLRSGISQSVTGMLSQPEGVLLVKVRFGSVTGESDAFASFSAAQAPFFLLFSCGNHLNPLFKMPTPIFKFPTPIFKIPTPKFKFWTPFVNFFLADCDTFFSAA